MYIVCILLLYIYVDLHMFFLHKTYICTYVRRDTTVDNCSLGVGLYTIEPPELQADPLGGKVKALNSIVIVYNIIGTLRG